MNGLTSFVGLKKAYVDVSDGYYVEVESVLLLHGVLL